MHIAPRRPIFPSQEDALSKRFKIKAKVSKIEFVKDNTPISPFRKEIPIEQEIRTITEILEKKIGGIDRCCVVDMVGVFLEAMILGKRNPLFGNDTNILSHTDVKAIVFRTLYDNLKPVLDKNIEIDRVRFISSITRRFDNSKGWFLVVNWIGYTSNLIIKNLVAKVNFNLKQLGYNARTSLIKDIIDSYASSTMEFVKKRKVPAIVADLLYGERDKYKVHEAMEEVLIDIIGLTKDNYNYETNIHADDYCIYYEYKEID